MEDPLKYALQICIVLLVAGILIFRQKIGIYYVYFKLPKIKAHYESTDINKLLFNKVEKIDHISEQLAAHSFFVLGSNGSKDASHILNSMLGFEDQEAGLKLPKNLIKKLDGSKNFSDLSIDWTQNLLDFKWISKIKEYDHWNFDQFYSMDKDKYYGYSHYPLPNFETLLAWGKLRLLFGRDHGDIENSLIETRHLARILFTTDNFEGVQSAIDLLSFETMFWNHLDDSVKSRINWPALPQKTLSLAKKYFLKQQIIDDPRISDELFLKINDLQVGRCYRINQMLLTHLLVRDFLREQYKDSLNRVATIEKNTRTSCRNSLVRQAWHKEKYWIMGNNMTLKKIDGLSKLKSWLTQTITLDDLINEPQLGKAITYDILNSQKFVEF